MEAISVQLSNCEAAWPRVAFLWKKIKICLSLSSVKFSWIHKFSFDNKVTFSRRSVDKTERNSSLCEDTTVPTHKVSINPLHPKVSMLMLHTVFSAFPKVLTRRFCLTSRASVLVDHFRYSRDLNVWFRSDIVRRN